MADAEAPPQRCKWITKKTALVEFASSPAKTQSSAHIKPIHWYISCRLALEGGFMPEEISPRPPFKVRRLKRELLIEYDAGSASGSEQIILGGLKTKSVDVVVCKPGLGPVLAVSCKGMTKALRNLTNRMEETIGECTNLHITYPALVFGYLFAIRANHKSDQQRLGLTERDIAITSTIQTDTAVESIERFHFALTGLSGRKSIRNEYSKYEAVSLVLVDMRQGREGVVLDDLMPEGSKLKMGDFFSTLYRHYDERFVVSAPQLTPTTRRVEWSPNSPIFEEDQPLYRDAAYRWRLAE